MTEGEPDSLAEVLEQLEAIASWEEHPILPESIAEESEISERVVELRHLFGVVRDHLATLQMVGLPVVGVGEIVATVGEAAHKLDAIQHQLYGPTFTSVTTFPEYRELTRLYLDHLASQQELAAASEPLHIETGVEPDRKVGLTDMERVKRDTDYELFFLRRGDGSPYACDAVVDGLKIACDFGPAVWESVEMDPLVRVQFWVDRWHQGKAAAMVAEEIEGSERALLALHLAANPANLLSEVPKRSCSEYFLDFLGFLRADPTPSLARALYVTRGSGLHEVLDELTEEAADGSAPAQYRALQEVLRRHPNGPLFKTLDVLREGPQDYDPMLRGNVPGQIFDVEGIPILRLPTPTHQATVEVAGLIPEFLAFLEAGSHLLFNFQDRLSWSEEKRAEVLEGTDCVVTMAKDTAFYHQEGPYAEMDEAHDFLSELESQLFDEEGGYYFPEWLCDPVRAAVEEMEVGARYMTRAERCAFIECFQTELMERLILFAKPDTVGLCCKDGVDKSMAAAANLYLLTRDDPRPLREMIFLPALLIRERAMLPERFSTILFD